MNHGRRILPLLATVAALVLPGVAQAQAQVAACKGTDAIPTAADVSTVKAATLCLINQERSARGLVRLHSDEALETVATRYSRTMVRGLFFGHVSPSGSTLVQRVKGSDYLDGANGWTLGENLAWGAGSRATPAETVAAWMASPGHRANVLEKRYRQIGIGIVPSAPQRLAGTWQAATYTTDFGAHL